MALYRANPLMLRQVLTGDESWCYSYEPNTREKSKMWLHRNDQCPMKALHPHSQKCMMLVTFFNDHSVVHFEFVNRTVNRYVYTRILSRLKEQVCKKCPGMWAPGFGHAHSLLLHLDNASSYTAYHTHAHLHQSQITTLEQPPYSLDLAPVDYFFFLSLKSALRSWHYYDIPALQRAVWEAIQNIAPEEFCKVIEDLPCQWQKCVDNQSKGSAISALPMPKLLRHSCNEEQPMQ